jgi:DNA-directed RNA polymerase subunit delta
MRRVIVDYAKLTNDILSLLVEKFPEGYDESDIIRFKNAQNELIEAVEVRTEDTIYLVKVSKKLVSRMDSFDEEEDLSVVDVIAPVKGIDLDEEEEDDEEDENKIKNNHDEDEDDDEDFDQDEPSDEDDDDEDDY